jgi:hypothetical protein
MVVRSNSPLNEERSSKRPRIDNVIPVEILAPENEAELVEEEMKLPIEISRTYEHELDYRNKLVLAPMVRTGSCEYASRN